MFQSRRLLSCSCFFKSSRPFCSSVSANPPKQPTISSSSSSSAPPDMPIKSSWNLLKLGVFGAITGVAATAGYSTYAYTLEEVDEKTKGLRESTNYTTGDDASAFQKFQALLYSTVMKVPAKSIELYLDLRRSIEEQVRDFTEPSSEKLLPDLHPQEKHVFTLVLDLNEL